MYNLPHYKTDNYRDVVAFMHEHPFITLVGCDLHSEPVATHVPVLLDEHDGKLFLTGHIMKQTDHHKAFLQNPNVLGIFTGPNTYVSASWYTNKKQGSTWNYLTVHAKGNLRFGDEGMLTKLLSRLTAHFENDPNSPSLFEKLTDEYVQKLIKAIVAFEIEVTDVDHVFKLSQNSDQESYNNIVDKLKEGNNGAKEISEIMKNRQHQVFKVD